MPRNTRRQKTVHRPIELPESYNKKPKQIPENDSPTQIPLENVSSSSITDKNSTNVDNSQKTAPTQELSEKQQGKLPENAPKTPQQTQPKIFKRPSWDDLVEEDMNVDDDEDNHSVSSEFLREKAAEEAAAAKDNENAENADGDTADNKTPIKIADIEENFIHIFKPTKFIGTIPMDAVNGNTPQDKLKNVRRLMIIHAGFTGAKINHRTRAIDVYFNNEYSLSKMIDAKISDFKSQNFVIINSKEQREKEKDRTIRVTDIPLNVKSEDIKNFFENEGNITRFSMITRGVWQSAYIVYDDPRSIKAFYDHVWSIQILDFRARVYPLDLSDEQLEHRNAFSCKLTGLPFNTSANDLQEIISQSKAKSCFIPRSTINYRPMNYAFLQFNSARDVEKAIQHQIKLNGQVLYWCPALETHCRRCGDPSHKSSQCKATNYRRNQRFTKLYDRFKPAQYRPRFNYRRSPDAAPQKQQQHVNYNQSSTSINPGQQSYSNAVRSNKQPNQRSQFDNHPNYNQYNTPHTNDSNQQHSRQRQNTRRNNTTQKQNQLPPPIKNVDLSRGTAAGGSMHTKPSSSPTTDKQFELLLQRMESMNENFMKLTQSVSELAQRVTDIEYDMNNQHNNHMPDSEIHDYSFDDNQDDMRADFHEQSSSRQTHATRDDAYVDIHSSIHSTPTGPNPYPDNTSSNANAYNELLNANARLLQENHEMGEHLKQIMIEFKEFKEMNTISQ
jgi:hypothetical protein